MVGSANTTEHRTKLNQKPFISTTIIYIIVLHSEDSDSKIIGAVNFPTNIPATTGTSIELVDIFIQKYGTRLCTRMYVVLIIIFIK
jgi:hypothetical protein